MAAKDKSDKPDPREARLAKALRENLRRRKAGAAARTEPRDPDKSH